MMRRLHASLEFSATSVNANTKLQQENKYMKTQDKDSITRSKEDEERCEFRKGLDTRNSEEVRERYLPDRGERVKGECEWIKGNVKYHQWRVAPSSLLWISGSPGKGNNMLWIFVAETLHNEIGQRKDAVVLEMFCRYQDEKRDSVLAVLKSLICQLLSNHPHLWGHVITPCKEQSDLLRSSLGLWRVFENMIGDDTLEEIYCDLDALDECLEESTEELLKHFVTRSVQNKSKRNNFHLIIFSRTSPPIIESRLSNFPRLDLDNDEDAKTSVEQDLKELVKMR